MPNRLTKNTTFGEAPIIGYTTPEGGSATPDGQPILGFLPDGRPILEYVTGGVTALNPDGSTSFVATSPGTTFVPPTPPTPYDPYAKYRGIPYGWWNGHWIGMGNFLPSRSIPIAEWVFWLNKAEEIDGLLPVHTTLGAYYNKDLLLVAPLGAYAPFNGAYGNWRGWVWGLFDGATWVVSHPLVPELGGSPA